MRLSILGIWIVLISIVKCQTNQLSDCYDMLTKVTAEVSPFVQSSICADNSPTAFVIDSPRGFWFNNARGFCTNSNLSTGFVNSNYLVTFPSLSVQLLKLGRVLDATKVTLSIREQYSGTHLVTAWGHQNTRFVMKIVRTCQNVETTSTTTTTTTTSPRVTTQKRDDSGTTSRPEISPSTTEDYSGEKAKIAWMESKRIEFEKKMASIRAYSEDDSYNMEASDYSYSIKPSEIMILTQSVTSKSVDDHQGGVDFNTILVSFSTSEGNTIVVSSDSISPSTVRDYTPTIELTANSVFVHSRDDAAISLNVNTNNMIRPTSVYQDVVTISSITTPDGGNPFYETKMVSSVSNFPSSIRSTGPAEFFQIYGTETVKSYSFSAISPSTSSSFTLELETTKASHSISHSLYPSEIDVLISPSLTPDASSRDNTHIPASYSETPTFTEGNLVSTTVKSKSQSTTPKYPDFKTSGVENSTIPLKKAEDDMNEETFWPVVAALVVGIPSVVVFGIAIVVIHRRRSPMTRKIFAMRSFSNLSTPSSSLPGYSTLSSKRKFAASQSSV